VSQISTSDVIDVLIGVHAFNRGNAVSISSLARMLDVDDLGSIRSILNGLEEQGYLSRSLPTDQSEKLGWYIDTRYFLTDENDEPITTKDGDFLDIRAIGEGEVPASDRLVSLDHNSDEYHNINEQLAGLVGLVKENNQVGSSAAERERILFSLEAAQKLWSSSELKLIQIKIGVIMAIEDAGAALKKVGKLVGVGLLIDAIKALVKASSGIDF